MRDRPVFHLLVFLAFVGLLLAASALSPAAHACCNVIPPVASSFPGDTGSVDRAFAGPNDTVRIFRNPIPGCDKDPFQGTLEVTLAIGLENKKIEKTVAPTIVDINTLEFTVDPAWQVAGPTTITVTNASGVVLAKIEHLYTPRGTTMTSCPDRSKKAIFETFTILPASNAINSSSFPPEILYTVDGSGSALVPFTHPVTSVPGAMVWYERGVAAKFKIELGNASDWDKLIRTFSDEGFRLPFVARVNDDGQVFGTAESGSETVIRVASTDKDGNPVYDFAQDVPASGHQPIKLKDGTSLPFDAENCGEVPVAMLRSSGGMMAFRNPGDDRFKAFDFGSAFPACGEITGEKVDVQSVIAVRGRRAAYASPDAGPSVLRTMKLGEAEKTHHAVDAAPQVDGKSVEISHFPNQSRALVFSRQPGGDLHVLALPGGELPGVATPSSRLQVSNGRALAIPPLPPGSTPVRLYDGANDQLRDFFPTEDAAISSHIVALRTSSGPVEVYEIGPPDNMKMTLPDVKEFRAHGDDLLYTTSSGFLKKYDFDRGVIDVHKAVVDFVLPKDQRTPLVAFRVREADLVHSDDGCDQKLTFGRCDLNGDGDNNDLVLKAFKWNDAQSTDRLASSATAAFDDYMKPPLKCFPGFAWLHPYLARSKRVVFVAKVDETSSACDNYRLAVFNVMAESLHRNSLRLAQGSVTGILQEFAGEEFLRLAISESSGSASTPAYRVFGDTDDDGMLDAYDNCVDEQNPRQIDIDCDGLGDRACDDTLCTTFQPPSIRRLNAGCEAVAATAAAAYLRTRLAATSTCLSRISASDEHPDGTTHCRGYFVDEVEVPPADEETAAALQAARTDYGEALKEAGCHGRQLEAGEHVRRVYSQTASALTEVTFGQLPALSGSAFECQTLLGSGVAAVAADLVDETTRCLLDADSDPGACLPRIEDGKTVPPIYAAGITHGPRGSFLGRIRGACPGDTLTALDACGRTIDDLEACLDCATARRVDEAIVSLNLLRKPGETEPLLGCELPRRRPSRAQGYKKDAAG